MMEDRNNRMYNSLRLAAGGGINVAMKKARQASDSVTLAIGIGGTGIDALYALKKMVYDRVEPDHDVEGLWKENPQYRRIKFLAIDADCTEMRSPYSHLGFSEEEFQYLGVSNIAAKLPLIKKAYLNWLNPNIPIVEKRKGAGGVRQVGRYLLAGQASQLKSKIKTLIRDAIIGMDGNSSINIYVMAGIGGGTGSGCFIDVCYLVRQALEELAEGVQPLCQGVYFYRM